ncbi:MAG: hypothetical protein HY927_10180 [Elusimicrobia bacterium]|nr:hypothetical protein [Elusimicrobiota bacterium]
MRKIEDTVTLFAAPSAIWPAMVDVPRWWAVLFSPLAKHAYREYGWSETLRPLGGEGQGMRWAAVRGDISLQTLRVSQWNPPTSLAVATDEWDPGKSLVMIAKGMPLGSGKLMAFVSTFSAVQGTVTMQLTPVNEAQTKLDICFDLNFPHPFADLLFSRWIGGKFRRSLASLVQVFPSFLEEQR